jgi:serine/threonine protein kinase
MDATRLPEEEKATVTREPLLEAVGTHIGPYKLVQQLGEGGMGTVFVADQATPVKRRVALKVIKPGMDSVQILHRFEAERIGGLSLPLLSRKGTGVQHIGWRDRRGGGR